MRVLLLLGCVAFGGCSAVHTYTVYPFATGESPAGGREILTYVIPIYSGQSLDDLEKLDAAAFFDNLDKWEHVAILAKYTPRTKQMKLSRGETWDNRLESVKIADDNRSLTVSKSHSSTTLLAIAFFANYGEADGEPSKDVLYLNKDGEQNRLKLGGHIRLEMRDSRLWIAVLADERAAQR